MKSILIAVTVVFTGSLALAQNAAVQQTNIQQSQYGMERAASETQAAEKKKKVLIEAESEDLGRQVLLEPTRKRPYFKAQVDQQYGYTDNAFLTENNQIGSGLWTSNFFLEGYVPLPESLNSLTVAVNVQETLYRYDNSPATVLNFDRDAVGLNVNYNFRNDWIFAAGFVASQLRSTDNAAQIATPGEFYHEGVVQYSALKLFPIDPDNLVFGGYMGEYHFATPGTFSRSDNSLVIGYNRQLMPRLVGQLLYKGMAEIYAQDSPNGVTTGPNAFALEERNDWNNLVALSFTYSPTDWCSLRVSGTYSTNSSTAEQRDYDNLQAGGNISLNFTY